MEQTEVGRRDLHQNRRHGLGRELDRRLDTDRDRRDYRHGRIGVPRIGEYRDRFNHLHSAALLRGGAAGVRARNNAAEQQRRDHQQRKGGIENRPQHNRLNFRLTRLV